MRTMRRAGFGAITGLVLAIALLVALATPSHAASGESISRYDIDIAVNDDGSALFRETITYDFGPNARHGIERILPTLVRYDDASDRRYPLTVVTVTAVDASAQYSRVN